MIQLYSVILSMSLMPDVDSLPIMSSKQNVRGSKPQSTGDLLFRALHLAFSPRSSATGSPPWRSAAFAKRLLTASLHWPVETVLQTLAFVERLITQDPKLESLLSTEERTVDGIFRPDLEDPQLCNPFATSLYELRLLETSHPNGKVRDAASRLARFSKP